VREAVGVVRARRGARPVLQDIDRLPRMGGVAVWIRVGCRHRRSSPCHWQGKGNSGAQDRQDFVESPTGSLRVLHWNALSLNDAHPVNQPPMAVAVRAERHRSACRNPSLLVNMSSGAACVGVVLARRRLRVPTRGWRHWLQGMRRVLGMTDSYLGASTLERVNTRIVGGADCGRGRSPSGRGKQSSGNENDQAG
jgi:hypothetical protein